MGNEGFRLVTVSKKKPQEKKVQPEGFSSKSHGEVRTLSLGIVDKRSVN